MNSLVSTSKVDRRTFWRFSSWLPIFFSVLFWSGSLQAAFWQGLYRAGAEVNSFQPCPGNLVYWVDGAGPVALSLREYALKHVQRPYQPFYVELVGELQGRRSDGAAAGYDGVLLLQSVEAITLQLPAECQNLPPEG